MQKAPYPTKEGFLLAEVLLAVAIFSLFAYGLTISFIYGREGAVNAGTTNRAMFLADEGLEAARQIRDRGFSELTDGEHGLSTSGGNWIFQDVSDTHDNFTRKITISTVDVNTKRVRADINWTPGQGWSRNVSLTSLLTNWRSLYIPPPAELLGGMLVYKSGSGVNYTVLNKDTATWSVPAPTALATDVPPTNIQLISSPTRNEKALISKHYDGQKQQTYAQIYDGTHWGNLVQLNSAVSTEGHFAFDVGATYLNNGDLIVVYSNKSKEPKYRVWDGTSWSGTNNISNIGGIPYWIILKNRPGTNEAMLAFYDSNQDTNTMYYNGKGYTSGNWILHVEHASNSPWTDRELIDFAWSPRNPTKGALIFTDQVLNMSLNTKIFTANGNGSGGWSSVAKTTPLYYVLGSLSVVGSRTSDEFTACDQRADFIWFKFITRLTCFKSDFTPMWYNPGNQILTTRDGLEPNRFYSLGYESQSGATALAIYSDPSNPKSPQIKKYETSNSVWDGGATQLTTLPGNVDKVKLIPRQNNDDIMIVATDNGPHIYTQVWDGINNQIYVAPPQSLLSHIIPNGTSGSIPFDFVWEGPNNEQ